MERTNVTDKGYTYGGKNYVYETRTDAQGAKYTVDKEVPSQDKTYVSPSVYQSNGQYYDKSGNALPNYAPAFQTTTQAVKQDQKNLNYIDSLTGEKSQTTATGQPVTTAQGQNQPTGGTNADGTPITPQKYVTPDGSTEISEAAPTGAYEYENPATLQEGEKVGYDSTGRRYIIDKDGKVKSDTFGDKEYKANKQAFQDKADLQKLYNDNKANLDSTHQMLIDNIQKQYENAKIKAKELGEKYLGLRQTQGYESGMARYMAGVNTGILEQQEKTNLETMSDLDVKYNGLLAQAIRAKASDDIEMVTKLAGELKSVTEQKQKAVEKAYTDSVAFTKAIRDQEKEVQSMEKARFDTNVKRVASAAPALLKGYDAIKSPELKAKFLKDYAEKYGMNEEEIAGVIEKARGEYDKTQADIDAKNRSNRPKGSTGAVDPITGEDIPEENMSEEDMAKYQEKESFFQRVDKLIASEFKNSEGVPTVVKGYLSYAAFKDLLEVAVQQGITREEFINRYQARLNLSTLSRAKSGYGLTDKEYTTLKAANK